MLHFTSVIFNEFLPGVLASSIICSSVRIGVRQYHVIGAGFDHAWFRFRTFKIYLVLMIGLVLGLKGWE